MSPIHPEMLKFAALYEEIISLSGHRYLRDDNYAEIRELFLKLQITRKTLPPVREVAEQTIPAPGREIPVRIYWPDAAGNRPLLLWFHGGGWVFGDLGSADLNCHQLCHDVGCTVVSVAYRLAPETRFPGAIDDALVALQWVATHAISLGVDKERLAVGGDSAGANLAACLALRARANGPAIRGQLLIYPVLAADFDTPSYLAHGQNKLLTRRDMRWYWDQYVPHEADRTNPLVAPIYAADLAGLPPALIITAEYDPLRDEAESYGAALAKHGVAVETHRYGGMIHNFYNYASPQPIPAVSQAREQANQALRRFLYDDES